MSQSLSDKAKKHKVEYNNQYIKENYKRVSLTMPFEQYNKVKATSDTLNTSVNAFIKSAIDEKLENIAKQSK